MVGCIFSFLFFPVSRHTCLPKNLFALSTFIMSLFFVHGPKKNPAPPFVYRWLNIFYVFCPNCSIIFLDFFFLY